MLINKWFVAFAFGLLSGMVFPDSRYIITDLKDKSNHYDYLVITTDSFVTEISRLLDHRLNWNYDEIESPGIAIVDSIYAAFPSEKWPHQKIHSFLRYAYENWQKEPRYILLLGGGYLGESKEHPNAIVPYFPELTGVPYIYRSDSSLWRSRINNGSSTSRDTLINTIYQPNDDYYSLDSIIIDTSAVTPVIDTVRPCVGRVPAMSVADVRQFVNKTITWDTATAFYENRLQQYYIVDDDLSDTFPDPLYHLRDAESFQDSVNNGYTIPIKFYEGSFPSLFTHPVTQDTIVNLMYDGFNKCPGIVSLFGHGGISQFTGEALIQYPRDSLHLKNARGAFFMDALACNTLGGTDDMLTPSNSQNLRNSFVVAMLFDSPGLVCCGIGGYKPLDVWTIMKIRSNLYRSLFCSSNSSVAKLFRAARKSVWGPGYGFVGDPALRLFRRMGTLNKFTISQKSDSMQLKFDCMVDGSVNSNLIAILTAYAKGEGVVDQYPNTYIPAVLYNRSPIMKWQHEDTFVITGHENTFTFQMPLNDLNQVSYLHCLMQYQRGMIDTVLVIDSLLSTIETPLLVTTSLFSTYPNPFSSYLHIVFNCKNISQYASVDIYDVKGRKVADLSKLKLDHIQWRPTLIPDGIYFLKVMVGGKVYMRRLCLL